MKTKTVLVTGSSRGIGKEIAKAYSKLKYNVVLNCKTNIEKMDNLVLELKKENDNVIGVQADVGNFEEAKNILKIVKDKFGDIDILINNAAISYVGTFDKMTETDWKNIFSANLFSVINCSNLVIKSMIKNKNGNIINISSIWGDRGASCEVIYSTTKGGINSFTKSLAKELGPSNIKVNAISCGVFKTEMNSWLSKEDEENLVNEISLMRFGNPEEVANLCLFLTSEKSKYITGEIINIDGGFI